MNLFDDQYFTIKTQVEGIFKDKGSKFLGYAFPVSSENQVKEFLDQIKKEHFSASHHCFAYRLGADKSRFRSFDDGEPANTAGRPILNQIISHDLTNTLIIVVRYFGGKLLGVPGLINAYKSATSDALQKAEIVTKVVHEKYKCLFPISGLNAVMKALKEEDAHIVSQDFENFYSICFKIRRANADRLLSKIKTVEGLKIEYWK